MTQTQYYAEELEDIFLRKRPSLPKEFLGKLEDSNSRDSPSIICVTGKYGSGKTMLVMELMSRAILLPNEEAPDVLFVNIEKDFNILKFMEISTKYVQPEPDNPDYEHNVVRQSLSRLHILTCNGFLLDEIIKGVERAITENQKIALVLIDSLGMDFFSEALSSEQMEMRILSKDAYISKYHEQLCKLIRKFNVTVVYTKPQYMQGHAIPRTDKIFGHRINLRKLNEVVYTMTINSNEKEKQLWYKIDFYGIKIVEE